MGIPLERTPDYIARRRNSDETLQEKQQEEIEASHQFNLDKGKMYHLKLEALKCRGPSLVYAIFLKEWWFLFQLCQLIEGKSCNVFTKEELFIFILVVVRKTKICYQSYTNMNLF
jgi:hypothetical protein